MKPEKKYLDEEGLVLYDSAIKAYIQKAIEKALADSKDYTDAETETLGDSNNLYEF